MQHSNDELQPGLAVVQSNRAEELRQVVVEHLRRHPLAPLEDEIVLVQSSGTARWLQLGLAFDADHAEEGNRGLGVCAATRFELPAQFMWSAYRAVLGDERLPDDSLFDAARLRWLIYRMLDNQVDRQEFVGLRHFLAADDDPRRKYQLAGAIADLFETYQFYRADWLDDWENGKDRLRAHDGSLLDLPPEQAWQPALWRTLVEMAGDAGGQHRGRLHREFVDALEAEQGRFGGLPRRLTVFGISALPAQTLRGLAALSRHSQVLVCLLNPCRYYWGNIVESRDDYRRWNARHPLKKGMPAEALTETQADQWANPLLASWGKQGRDFIDLLDEMDRPEDYQAWFDDRIDLFSDFAADRSDSLLRQIQQRILDLDPPRPMDARQPIAPDDESIRFTVAHSRQREVEILHDQMLAAMQEDEELQPRDIIVMVPDIDQYAPHIEAVFGNLAATGTEGSRDERFIPYSIGDRNNRMRSSFLRAVEDLLALPHSRLASTTVLDLLHVPALRQRFDLSESELELAARWLEGAGVRWGIDADHRAELLDATEAFEQNSWQFGLDRMLLGYATGRNEPFADILPYDEVAPGTAGLAAKIASLMASLRHWRKILMEPAAPECWAGRLRNLVEDFFIPGGTDDALDRYRFDQALDALVRDTALAGMDEPLPLEVVRDALVAELDRESLSKRFLTGCVSFSTLMPMRALPFRMVCLLGMNDGDYPRTRKPADFDLTDQFRRPGDRSRRDDDRYLFLEALLSARDRLHVSWVGRSIRDNSEIPPSVLVGQLRDAIAADWVLDKTATSPGDDGQATDLGRQLVEHLTRRHPLQPFSREYFRPGQRKFRTHAREWGEVWQQNESVTAMARTSGSGLQLPLTFPEEAIGLRELCEFYRQPVSTFMQRRLRINLTKRGDIGPPSEEEPFGLGSLEDWQLRDDLLRHLVLEEKTADIESELTRQLQRFRMEGRLPLAVAGEVVARNAMHEALEIGNRYFEQCDRHGPQQERRRISLSVELELPQPGRVSIQDWLTGLHGNADAAGARIEVLAGKVGSTSSPRWDKLARYWPEHLAGCAMGLDMQTVIVGQDKTLRFEPVARGQAIEWLGDIVRDWLVAQTRPLPVTPAVAGEVLKVRAGHPGMPEAEWMGEAMKRAQAAYVGNRFSPGPLTREPALSRLYPDFQALQGGEEDGLVYWSVRVYAAMVETFLEQASR